ncbi:site-specific DNA-methyltransferase [Vibrio splendidus]|uniref:site-specific DNA-methyltransferase n=1 Tax=Vibrio splendidus TaxID=29497 RepID=UPI0024684BBB|nr:DNA methyltransferase [Vibrio splendidus]MDH5897771.1 site-specific DNA-methyltransferase [Vibrio splendidus]
MSRLTDLIAQAKAKDPMMGADLEREFKALSSRRSFGLNFERHRPETVELPQRPVRKGDKVHVLPPKGDTSKGDQRIWTVKRFETIDGKKVAHLTERNKEQPEVKLVEMIDLVVVAEFRDKIYPGLVSTGKVENGGDKPFHSVINGENYHALKALTFTHRGKVDAIYIDPPYNTGAKDWKYNNDYVESEDLYRHSKWLAFIERRLKIAKELLNPNNSVLIATIDEKEYLRLGLLLEQVFPEARIQMISSVINPKGVPRDGFSRVDEYIYTVQIGDCKVAGEIQQESAGKEVRWRGLARTGANGIRSKSPGAFYPILFNANGNLVEIGDSLPIDESADSYIPPEGLIAVWPTSRPDGEDGRWSVIPETLRELLKIGAVKTGRVNVEKNNFPISYLTSNQLKSIESGELEVKGKTENGVLQVYYRDDSGRVSAPRTVWDKVSHSASEHGSMLLRALIPGRKFPFPKSLYAVEDVLRLFLKDKKDAVVLDFFSGSGTTAHAVMRLNKQDTGKRQSISITNNEVAAEEQIQLKKSGARLGDAVWEDLGICEHVTKPRVKAAVTGLTPNGLEIIGDYKFNDEFPMSQGFEENVEFFTLTYETPIAINHNLVFSKIAPLLWLRAGSQGQKIEGLPERGWDITGRYGVLSDLDKTQDFSVEVKKQLNMKVVYIITNDDRRFQSVVRCLPKGVEVVRLYESYLNNFQFTNGE